MVAPSRHKPGPAQGSFPKGVFPLPLRSPGGFCLCKAPTDSSYSKRCCTDKTELKLDWDGAERSATTSGARLQTPQPLRSSLQLLYFEPSGLLVLRILLSKALNPPPPPSLCLVASLSTSVGTSGVTVPPRPPNDPPQRSCFWQAVFGCFADSELQPKSLQQSPSLFPSVSSGVL